MCTAFECEVCAVINVLIAAENFMKFFCGITAGCSDCVIVTLLGTEDHEDAEALHKGSSERSFAHCEPL